jgi:NAD(P)-dependent dehydrogenase (short-subunit alcohol dehydrogenase family)
MSESRSSLFDIQDRVAVVTGAGGALAGIVSAALAQHGVKVLVTDIRKEKAEETAHTISNAGGTVEAAVCDVLNLEDLERCARLARDALGTPEFLVNGAGGNRSDGSTEEEFYVPEGRGTTFFDLTYEGMRNTFDLNYFGTVLPAQVFSRPMAEKKAGSIVNFASVCAYNPLTRVGMYAAAKSAVVSFTKWLATHLSKVNVRVNALAPGFIMTEQMMFMHLDEHGNYTPRARKAVNHTPFERYGRPAEIVGAVIWLLSDAASYVSGSVVTIDGCFSSYTV